MWIARFRAGGVGGLHGLPGRGKRPECDADKVAGLAPSPSRKNAPTPESLRELARRRLHVSCSVVNMRAIMHKAGFPRKASAAGPGNAADPADVEKWQKGAKGQFLLPQSAASALS